MTSFALMCGVMTDVHAGGKGNSKADMRPASQRAGSSKNDRHGDGGRALKSVERQIAEIQKRLIENDLNKKERQALEKKAQRIRENAQKKAKGETHSTKGKGRRK